MLVDLERQLGAANGVIGSRMTDGGVGACRVSLVVSKLRHMQSLTRWRSKMKELSKTTASEANVRINARPFTTTLAAVCLGLFPTVISAQSIVDQWRYTLRRPDGDWQKPEFDDRSWKDG